MKAYSLKSKKRAKKNQATQAHRNRCNIKSINLNKNPSKEKKMLYRLKCQITASIANLIRSKSMSKVVRSKLIHPKFKALLYKIEETLKFSQNSQSQDFQKILKINHKLKQFEDFLRICNKIE